MTHAPSSTLSPQPRDPAATGGLLARGAVPGRPPHPRVGSGARDADGALVGEGDFTAQLHQCFLNIQHALEAVGASMADLVKLNYFCDERVPQVDLRSVVVVRDRFVNTQRPPASSFVVVKRLARPEWLIEIEAWRMSPQSKWSDGHDRGARAYRGRPWAATPAAPGMVLECATRAELGCRHYAIGFDAQVAGRAWLGASCGTTTAPCRPISRRPHMKEFRACPRGAAGTGGRCDALPRRGRRGACAARASDMKRRGDAFRA